MTLLSIGALQSVRCGENHALVSCRNCVCVVFEGSFKREVVNHHCSREGRAGAAPTIATIDADVDARPGKWRPICGRWPVDVRQFFRQPTVRTNMFFGRTIAFAVLSTAFATQANAQFAVMQEIAIETSTPSVDDFLKGNRASLC